MKPLIAALGYISVGWRVAPAAPGKKHPMIDEWQKAATTDVNTIAGWFAGHDDRNVCIATGVESGIWVLDIDIKGDSFEGYKTLEALENRHEKLPDTYCVLTGSSGMHLYWAWTGVDFELRNSASRLGAGLDTRGNGGQVVAPPSRAAGHPEAYTLLDDRPPVPAPAWLLDLLRPRAVERPPFPAHDDKFLPGHDGILGWLASVQPGGQDQSLAWVIRALRDEGKAPDDARALLWPVMQSWPAPDGPWTERDLERHIRSAY